MSDKGQVPMACSSRWFYAEEVEPLEGGASEMPIGHYHAPEEGCGIFFLISSHSLVLDMSSVALVLTPAMMCATSL